MEKEKLVIGIIEEIKDTTLYDEFLKYTEENEVTEENLVKFIIDKNLDYSKISYVCSLF